MKNFQLLISRANNIIHSSQVYLNNALKIKGLGSAEANVLMFLYNNGDGVRQDEIVSGIEVSKPAISRTIAELEKKGYVRRKQHSEDKRVFMVFLTENARKEEEFIQMQYANLIAAACRGISQKEVDEFLNVFQQVSENIDAFRREEFLQNKENVC